MYLIIFFLTMAVSALALWRLKSVYNEYLQVPLANHYTGAEVAEAILREAGIRDVEVLQGEGMLGDHYDPTNKRLVLSPENYSGQSISAVGVAAHECGHALQHQQAYAFLHLRMAAVGLANFANYGIMLFPIVGLLTGHMGFSLMLMAGAWGILMLFNLITLPVEFDASARARRILSEMRIVQPGAEAEGVRRVLSAAAMTYVAAFVTSLAYFLYYALPLILGRHEEN